MNAATLKALNGSITKWRKIVAGTGEDRGGANCPLCKLFNSPSSPKGCDGCPVREKTGSAWCRGSPYQAWLATNAGKSEGTAITKHERALAQKELDFLISLRPARKGRQSTRMSGESNG